jgi:polysaccharide biosynthesis/export protein
VQDAGIPVTYNENEKSVCPDVIIKRGDLLVITVNSNTPEAAIPFNLPLIPVGEGMNAYGIARSNISSGAGLQNYLVDIDGNITFPILGKLQVAGLKKSELSRLIQSKIHPLYIKEEPVISIRYANFSVSVLGEVNRPGSFDANNENLTIFEAIALAGDLTIFGRRDNILLIREDAQGVKTTYRIDIRDSGLINSSFYYLQQNDVIYVQPNNPRTRGSALGAAETLSISVVGTLISLTSLLINILK